MRAACASSDRTQGSGSIRPASSGGVRVPLLYSRSPHRSPRRPVVGGDFDPGARGRSRSLGEQVPLGALAASPALAILLLAGLGLRLTIAYVLFPASGFATDLASYTSWATDARRRTDPRRSTPTPASPTIRRATSTSSGRSARSRGSPADPVGVASALIKLPPILIDMAVGYVLYRLVKGWAWPGRSAETVALVAAALYVFNPVSFYDSALWGQTDAAGALVLLLGIAALIRGNSEGAAALAAMAALVKPQFGVVLVPLVGVVLLKRHLLRPGSGPRHRPWAPAALAGWLDSHRGPVRLVSSLVVGLVVFHLVALPFGLDVPGYLRLIGNTAGGYAYLSVNAFNPWALVGSGGNPLARRWPDVVERQRAVPRPHPGRRRRGDLAHGAGSCGRWPARLVRDDRWTLIVALMRARHRLLRAADARPRALPLPGVRDHAAPRGGVAALARGSRPAEHRRAHQHARGPHVADLRDRQRRRPPARRDVPDVAVHRRLGACSRSACSPMPRGSCVRRSSPRPTSSSEPPTWECRRPSRRPAPAATATGELAPTWVRGPGVLDQLAIRSSRPPLRRAVDPAERRERPGRLDRLDVLVLVLLVVSAATHPRVPGQRAVRHVLRRGLSRAHRDGVPPALGVRTAPLDLRVHAPASREVRDGSWHRAGRREPGERRPPTLARPSRMPSSRHAGRHRRRPGSAMGTACTWPPGPSCACSTWRPARRSARSGWMPRRWRWTPRLTGCMSPRQAA